MFAKSPLLEGSCRELARGQGISSHEKFTEEGTRLYGWAGATQNREPCLLPGLPGSPSVLAS